LTFGWSWLDKNVCLTFVWGWLDKDVCVGLAGLNKHHELVLLIIALGPPLFDRTGGKVTASVPQKTAAKCIRVTHAMMSLLPVSQLKAGHAQVID